MIYRQSKFPKKYFIVSCFFIALLSVLFISSSVSIFSLGFLLDILFIFGFIAFIFLITGKDIVRNIIITIISSIITVLFIADHIYYSNFKKFASVSSLNNLHMVLDNADAYGVTLDFVSIIMLIICVLLNIYLYTKKYGDSELVERIYYFYPSLLIFAPFVITYYMAYNDIVKLDIILFPTRYKFPEFVKNFGYVVNRFEDIAIMIDSKRGG